MMVEGRSLSGHGDKIRLGMVGGGMDAFIGDVHRIASRLDDNYVFVAGALSSTPERSKQSGAALGLDPDRVYDSFEHMAKAEAARPDGIEAVAIVTPNHMHEAPASAFLREGIHVICDKPLTATLPEARALAAEAERSGALFVLTHNYTAYPMVREAQAMIADGLLGPLRVVQVSYAQDWMTEDVKTKQAIWRTNPSLNGIGGALGDIGTHAFNLAQFVTGLEVEGLAADLQSFVPGRLLDDNAHVMLRYGGGARGMLWCSQVAPGNENGLKLQVYGVKGGLEWAQEEPNKLWYTPYGEPKRLLTRNGAGTGPASQRLSRVPSGHPEGYLEGFANLYSEAAAAIRAKKAGVPVPPDVMFPTIWDGLAGMAFIDACVRSSQANSAWVELADLTP